MLDPYAWQRVSESPGRGSGRIDLWTVAWRITEEHPVNGIGLNNFGVVAADYVRDVGPLERVDLIADRPHSVHNAYLQFLAETGVVGLLLFSIFAVGCLYAGWRAAARVSVDRETRPRGDRTRHRDRDGRHARGRHFRRQQRRPASLGAVRTRPGSAGRREQPRRRKAEPDPAVICDPACVRSALGD